MPRSTVSCFCFPSSWTAHPIWNLRRLLILNSVVGIVFQAIAAGASEPYDDSNLWLGGIFIVALSGAVAFADILIWNHKRQEQAMVSLYRERCHADCRQGRTARDRSRDHLDSGRTPLLPQHRTHSNDDNNNYEDDRPAVWPSKAIQALDFVFSLLLFALFMIENLDLIVTVTSWNTSSTVIKTYATLPLLIGSVRHIMCWYKEYMAGREISWMSQLQAAQNTPEAAVTNDTDRTSNAFVRRRRGGEEMLDAEHNSRIWQNLAESLTQIDAHLRQAIQSIQSVVSASQRQTNHTQPDEENSHEEYTIHHDINSRKTNPRKCNVHATSNKVPSSNSHNDPGPSTNPHNHTSRITKQTTLPDQLTQDTKSPPVISPASTSKPAITLLDTTLDSWIHQGLTLENGLVDQSPSHTDRTDETMATTPVSGESVVALEHDRHRCECGQSHERGSTDEREASGDDEETVSVVKKKSRRGKVSSRAVVYKDETD